METIKSLISNLALANDKNMLQVFKDLIEYIFGFTLKESINRRLANLNIECIQSQKAIMVYTDIFSTKDLLPSDIGHKDLVFSFIPTTSHRRIDLINATKAINREIDNYNILFFVGIDKISKIQMLSIGFATRRANKHNSEIDTLESIILIKDINLENPSKAHLKNLESIAHNCKSRNTKIDQYYNEIFSILSIKALQDEFYKHIREHFINIIKSITLPSDTSAKDDKDRRAFTLRLISRIIFTKFLEKKGIIDSKIFDTKLSDEYYHEVLEPLFFTTLNTPKDRRDYGLLDSRITVLLESIPYLNGGLFTPQKEKDFFDEAHKDSFINILKVPNKPLQELFDTLEMYHFTLDENSPKEQEIGLDPEMLGMVFESLLSVLFTDNTNKIEQIDNLRKATGSYYTPREIVEYMVQSAILEYLKTECPHIQENKITSLVNGETTQFTNADSTTSLDCNEQDEVLEALLNMKVLDPACGSGAFPMGILNALCEILCILDPQALFTKAKWQNLAQSKVMHHKEIEQIKQCSDSFHSTTTAILNEESKSIDVAITESSSHDSSDISNIADIDSKSLPPFEFLTPHYIHKLYILQNIIYGIDIQPMATEISRLRAFLSLIIDEDSNHISALPNLEFKFISANSLLSLPQSEVLNYAEYEKDKQELYSLQAQTFTSHDKKELESRYLALRDKIAKESFATTKKLDNNPLLDYNPFDTQSVAGFFDSEFMFGIKSFDIVIGNPPYGAKISDEDKKKYRATYKYATQGSLDTYKLFIEMGFLHLCKNGILSFIVPISVTSSKSNINLHKLLLQNCKTIYCSSYGNAPTRIFSNADQRVSIISFIKTYFKCQSLLTTSVNLRNRQTSIKAIINNLCFIDSLDFIQQGAFCKISLQVEADILKKLYSLKHTLKDRMQGNEYMFYRDTGGRYYDLYANYSTTNSTTQKSFEVDNSKMVVTLLSSTLFWWFRNLYSEGRHSYIYEFERFPIPDFSAAQIKHLEILCDRYLADIEANADFSNSVKTYKIRKSKHIIDEIDKFICPIYGLNEQETKFIINYNIEFRTDKEV